MLAGIPGETIQGFNVPGYVENVEIPIALKSCIMVREIRKEYNIARGEITLYQVIVHPDLQLTRQNNEYATSDGHDVAVFSFNVAGNTYHLLFDSGTDMVVASFVVRMV